MKLGRKSLSFVVRISDYVKMFVLESQVLSIYFDPFPRCLVVMAQALFALGLGQLVSRHSVTFLYFILLWYTLVSLLRKDIESVRF